MTQLSLGMPQRLAYSPEGFYLYAGVKQIFSDCLSCLAQKGFGSLFLFGRPRSGKTHFSIYLADQLSKSGLFPRLLDGNRCAQWCVDKLSSASCSSDEVVLVDDAHEYFSGLSAERSGEFVALIEMFRVNNAKICFLSSKSLDDFGCDQHVMSRLRPSAGYQLGDPDPDEVHFLLAAMAKQRGILLTERQISYLVKRVSRNVPALEQFIQNVDYLSQVLGQPIKLSLLADAL